MVSNTLSFNSTGIFLSHITPPTSIHFIHPIRIPLLTLAYMNLCRQFTTTNQNNEKIHNAISEASKGECIIMGDFNHGNIKWDTQQSTGVEDQKLLCLEQDNFLTQHVLEPTRAARVLDIVLSSQKEFLDNVVIQEPLGSSDHNQLHFNINIKSDKQTLNNVGGILGEVTMNRIE